MENCALLPGLDDSCRPTMRSTGPAFVRGGQSHAPQNEEFTFVLSGTMEFTIKGHPVTARESEFVHMWPNVPKEPRPIGEAVVLGVITPIRVDWKD